MPKDALAAPGVGADAPTSSHYVGARAPNYLRPMLLNSRRETKIDR